MTLKYDIPTKTGTQSLKENAPALYKTRTTLIGIYSYLSSSRNLSSGSMILLAIN